MADTAHTEEINLGPVTVEEMVIGSYEALKMVFAASVAQLTTTDVGAARTLYDQMCNDMDLQRARFIQAMRDDAAEAVEAEVVEDEAPPETATVVDKDGFEYEQVIE